MKTVTFPGLGLEFHIDRIAFRLGNWPIYWYGIIIAAGFLLAVLFCSKKSKQFGILQDEVVDMLFFAVPLSIIGARVYYIIFYLDLFRKPDGSLDFAQMVRIWDGGLAIYGGVIVAVIVLLLFCKARKIKFLAFGDLGVFGLLIGQLVGRWGNFMNVEAYGGLTVLPWRMCSPSIADELLAKGIVDSAGWQQVMDGVLGVHPTFFYESLWNLIGFLLLCLIAKRWRKFDGQIFLSYFAWYGFGRGLIEGLRTDSLYLFHTGIRVSQLFGFVTAAVAVALLIWNLAVRKPDPANLWVNLRKPRRIALVYLEKDPKAVKWMQEQRKALNNEGAYLEEYALPEGTGKEDATALVASLKERQDLDQVMTRKL